MGKFLDLEELCGDDHYQVDASVFEDEIDNRRDRREAFEAEGLTLPAQETVELAMLLQFRREVEDITGSRFSDAVMVPEAMFEKFVRWDAEEGSGLDAESGLVDFVDWAGWAQCRQANQFKKVLLDAQVVWVQVVW
jgi:hypothetical protein